MINQIPDDVAEANRLKELLVQINTDETEDIISDLVALGDRPEVLSLVVYKLAKEREKTNQLLREINEKYDKLLMLVSHNNSPPLEEEFMAEQDAAIINLIKEKTKVTAKEVKDVLNYKGLNAASQRLNKLCKEGLLKKARAGQKVYFMLK